MKNNYYQKYLETIFKGLVEINGQFFHFKNHLLEYQKTFTDPDSKFYEIIDSTIAIRDLTLEKENKPYYNLHPVNLYYRLNRDNLESQNSRLISRECGFQIAQAYEELEMFLYNIIATYIQKNRPVNDIDISLNDEIDLLEIIDRIKILKNRINNKHLLKILRKISPNYRELEGENLRKLNFIDWYDSYSQVRHAVIHKSQILNKAKISKMNSSKKDLLRKHFPFIEHRDEFHLNFKDKTASDAFTLTGEFAFLIFKSLSKKR